MKTGRNDPCPCGSGRKYKHCCLNRRDAMPLSQKLLAALIGLVLLTGVIIGIGVIRDDHAGSGPGPGKVWSEEHQHWH